MADFGGADLDAFRVEARQWLEANFPPALKGKGAVFITGYCYGGTVTWAAACKCDGLAAASGYYGGNIPQMATENPKCPVILHFGEHDHGIPMDGIEKVRAAHPEVAIYIYDAGHGFNSDRRTDYNAEAAKLGRERTLALFRANGGTIHHQRVLCMGSAGE